LWPATVSKRLAPFLWNLCPRLRRLPLSERSPVDDTTVALVISHASLLLVACAVLSRRVEVHQMLLALERSSSTVASSSYEVYCCERRRSSCRRPLLPRVLCGVPHPTGCVPSAIHAHSTSSLSFTIILHSQSTPLHEIPLKCTIRLNALPKPIENRENSQLLNFNNFTYYNKINIIFL
jgi:hypothetical protein